MGVEGVDQLLDAEGQQPHLPIESDLDFVCVCVCVCV